MRTNRFTLLPSRPRRGGGRFMRTLSLAIATVILVESSPLMAAADLRAPWRQLVGLGDRALAQTTFADNFAGPSLDPFWTWAPGGRNFGPGTFGFGPAGLGLVSHNTDYTSTNFTDPTVSAVQSGDWTARVQVGGQLLQPYDAVGLIGANPSNPEGQFWKLEYVQYPEGAFVNVYDGGTHGHTSFTATKSPYFQVVKTADQYTFSYS